jgi:hypothetical protein
MNDLHSHHRVLDAIGPRTLCTRLQVSPTRANNWRRRGVPAAFLLRVKALADELGHPLPADFLVGLGIDDVTRAAA